MTLIYKIDRSLEGLYSALFYAYKNKEKPDFVGSAGAVQSGFDCLLREVAADKASSVRVENGLKKILGAKFGGVELAYASGQSDKETVIFRYLYNVFEKGRALLNAVHLPYVAEFDDIVNRVTKEIRHIYGFLRFKETEEGFYYAEITPDNDIVKFIMPHFCDRFACMKFAIHDTKRNILGLFNGAEYKVVTNIKVKVTVTPEDAAFRDLWKEYVENAALPDRRRPKLRNACMPVRYQKMTEDF